MDSKDPVISILRDADARMPDAAGWSGVLDRAVREGLFYPFYRKLSACFPPMSGELLERFRQTYYLHLAKSAEFSRGVDRVLDRIESFSVPVLLFKGPAVDQLIYAGEFFRPRLDLDIAVRDGDAGRLEEALAGLGYAQTPAEKDCPLPEYGNSRLLNGGPQAVTVHVHRQIVNNLFLCVDGAWSMDMGKVWEETAPFREYRFVRTPAPEMSIVFLCEHGLKHGFDQAVYLYEIERLVRCHGDRFDWDRLGALARAFGLARIVYHSLYLAAEVFGCTVPRGVLEGLRPERLTAGERSFIRGVLAGTRRRYPSYPVYLSMRQGLAGKVRYVFRTVFPPRIPLKGHLNRLGRSILAQ